ncbi:MAG: Isoleucine-tRNA ligase [Candidatus Nomurabacteria bacterium GW2011_GWB1_35_20]|uniref:Isoleucine-tRNA ligase n=1 Tax=Candidatus Nomurabacteria bacterium GW2011_GWB1_35_20 TaxID=1618740 RepID=A0A0G0C9V5_9BACT|nr:MAG: Isoleucine-tRNA ligase [Candidatus Nomurabacteria bacterium GW2011_GWB1_35_20]
MRHLFWPSWFVNIQKVKNNLLKNAKSMNWVPSHLKGGRFKNTMESAPDWTISRNRYWASPLPFWKSSSGKIMFVNSIEDLKSKTKKSGNKYFVMRHGEAENNVLKVCSSAPDNIHHLTEKGKKQVTEAVKSLVDKNIDMIFASSFLRTEETTNIIKKVINFPSQNIKIDSRLVELNDGIFADGPIQKVHDFFKNNNLSKYDGAPEGGESLVDVKKRVGEFIYEIDRKYQNKNILIITHEDTVWALFSAINGLNKEETMDDIKNNFLLKNAEIKEFNFIPLPHNDNYELDLHRPYIDNIVLVDEKREEYKRIPEVIDCWFESGSMPFAQDHYPFENLDWKKKNFPAGFVAEYIAQTRTWFYYTHVISSILFRKAPFENVVTTGTILAEDGEKMSKSRNNFPDPWILFNKYGVDALRFYLMSCPVMKGEDINFSEKSVQDISNKIISRLNNVLAFYELYRDPQLKILEHKKSENMEKYDISLATRPVESFIEDLSTWYLRRSRDRIKNGDEKAKQTLYFVLKNLAKLMAPFAPFAAEDIWLKLKNENDVESVHLESWPSKTFKFFSFGKSKILENMEVVRKVVTLGLEARQKAGIKVRQPLAKLEIKNYKLDNEYETLIKDELNVKKIIFEKRSELKSSERSDLGEVLLDTKITPELKLEGNM